MANIRLPEYYPVTCHTDRVGPGSTFVAIKGFTSSGLQFVPEALEKGASLIIVADGDVLDDSLLKKIDMHGAGLKRVANTRQALATESAHAAGYPASKLTIVGVTGTKGKTTTSYLLAHILREAGYKTALISTVKNSIDGNDLPAPLTTPQPDYLHQFFKLCVEYGVTHVVMEVAAQALSMHRVEGIEFAGIIFTNFSREHLEFYSSLEDYFAAKCALFRHRGSDGIAFINGDDPWLASLKNRYSNVRTFGFSSGVDIVADRVETRGLIRATIHDAQTAYTITCGSLAGRYNVYNVVAAASMARNLGVQIDDIVKALATFDHVPGRFEQYSVGNNIRFVIDYAHNPSSFEQLLPELRAQTDYLIVVFGAGGNRDAGKRPIMGKIAAQYADMVILTSDNPRDEDPVTITQDILKGIEPEKCSNVIVELDRARAISTAYQKARPGALIGLLGKGPDEYQQVGSIKTPFSEKAIIKALVK